MVKKKAKAKPKAKTKSKRVVKKKMVVRKIAHIAVRGIGNQGFGRTMLFSIDSHGNLFVKVGCQAAMSASGIRVLLGQVKKKYGEKSPYYQMCLLCIKELKRRHRSKKAEADSYHFPVWDLYQRVRDA